MLDSHRTQDAAATIAVHRIADVRGSGRVTFTEAGRATQYVEKPPFGEAQPGWVNAGVYLLEQVVVAAIPEGKPADFGYDVFPRTVAEGIGVFVHRLTGSEAVYGVDTPARYRATLELLAQ